MWGRFFKTVPKAATTLEHIAAPDGDTVELHHLAAPAGAPRVLMLHGLEGSRDSHYVGGMFAEASRRNWGATLLVFRGCGSSPNSARRFYHSGETTDLEFTFSQLTSRWPEAGWCMVGVSLGGNVLLKWMGEREGRRDPRIRAAVAISTPFDLDAGARHISRGFARVYGRNFVRSLVRKAMAKLSAYPDLFDRNRVMRARSIYEFDDAVTAPVHGFHDAADYYAQSSALGFLGAIRAPTLLLSSRDDPFLPEAVLNRVTSIARANAHIRIEFHDTGGHVGFVAGRPWRPFYYAEWRTFRFFDEVMERRAAAGYD